MRSSIQFMIFVILKVAFSIENNCLLLLLSHPKFCFVLLKVPIFQLKITGLLLQPWAIAAFHVYIYLIDGRAGFNY